MQVHPASNEEASSPLSPTPSPSPSPSPFERLSERNLSMRALIPESVVSDCKDWATRQQRKQRVLSQQGCVKTPHELLETFLEDSVAAAESTEGGLELHAADARRGSKSMAPTASFKGTIITLVHPTLISQTSNISSPGAFSPTASHVLSQRRDLDAEQGHRASSLKIDSGMTKSVGWTVEEELRQPSATGTNGAWWKAQKSGNSQTSNQSYPQTAITDEPDDTNMISGCLCCCFSPSAR
jgi:hypothetical protein